MSNEITPAQRAADRERLGNGGYVLGDVSTARLASYIDALTAVESDVAATRNRLTLCPAHAEGWQSDGSCPLCEGQALRAELNSVLVFLHTLTRYIDRELEHVTPMHTVGANQRRNEVLAEIKHLTGLLEPGKDGG